MDDLRKRTRQACEPCRRKKSKCTGEKPGCSTCERLRQPCLYAADPRLMTEPVDVRLPRPQQPVEPALHNRVQSIEATLAQVLESLQAQNRHASTVASPPQPPPPAAAVIEVPPQPDINLPPLPVVLSAGRDYLHFCEGQPIPLFDPDSFVASLPSRDPELLLAVLALAGRFSDGVDDTPADAARYADRAHRLAMARVADGRVELSTIQTLCLLALTAFDTGAIDRCRTHSALAMALAHGARLNRDPEAAGPAAASPGVEERRRCYWGLVLLRRLFGWPVDAAEGGSPPLFPASPSSPAVDVQVRHRVDGILSTVIQLAEVWALAQDYVRNCRRSSPAAVSPWSPDTPYARALRRLMDLGRDLPTLHRNRCVRLAAVPPADLGRPAARAYWAPWFLSHFLFHTAICLLNHPLLMTLQFQHARGFSEVFLQQSAHLAAYHGSWLLHFVAFFDDGRRFSVSDPLFGYCAAVVATIELQHSFSGDAALRQAARARYDRCLAFMRTLARRWPHVRRLAAKLERLADQMARHDALNASDTTLTVSIAGFLEILDLAASAHCGPADPSPPSLFGASLAGQVHDEVSDPTPLSRLPAITTLDPAMAIGRTTETVPSAASPALPDGDMFLPADQLLGGHLQDVNAWWSGTWGDAPGDWGVGGPGLGRGWLEP